MIYGVMVTYNDWPTIQRAVESIVDKVDSIVAVDGKYIDFPGDTPHSTDGTLEYLHSIEKVTVIMASDLMEVDKRNRYLVGSDGDWYLHLDADEEWVGDVRWGAGTDMMITPLRRKQPRQWMNRVRLFRHTEALHYAKKHYWLFDRYGKTFALLERPGEGYRAGVSQSHIVHYEEERSAERKQAKRRYYKILYKRESAIKEVTA
jgi:hypothetical protein